MTDTGLPLEALGVLDFWFRELKPSQWFGGGGDLDARVRERFGKLLAQARAGAHDDWIAEPRGRLALVVLLDQFSRHIYRDDAAAFTSDAKAQALAREAIALGIDQDLNFAERHFLYMPLMHAEDRNYQALSVDCFDKLREFAEAVLKFAEGHCSIIERFGRFPHRNVLLGRTSSPEEEDFLRSDENLFR